MGILVGKHMSTSITLNNGVTIPMLGFGTYQIRGQTVEKIIHWALTAGYRHIDTAMAYSNEKRIGNIDQRIHEVLLKELHNGKGWFKVRKHLTPCKGCIYNQICPPISNYEYALSRNNLCGIHLDRCQDNDSKDEINAG